MDKNQYSTALQNAVAFLKGQKIIKKEIEISIDTGFSKGAVSNYITGKQQPSKNFIDKFAEVYSLDLNQFAKAIPIPVSNPESIVMGTIMRTEAQVRVTASYVAEIYGHLKNVPVAKVLRDMESMVEADTLSNVGRATEQK